MFKKPIIALPVILALMLNGLAFATPQMQVDEAQAAGTVVYNLFATDTFVKMADGKLVYNYGFVGGRAGVPFTYQRSFSPVDDSGGDNVTVDSGPPAPTGGPITPEEQQLAGNAQFPGPIIYASKGDVVEIRLKNLGVTFESAPNDPHSIHLHGMDVNAANDGVPETSVGAVPANLTTGGQPVPGAGNVVVYMFSPKVAGTYMYHCHQEADIHVQMGMYGALVIYNSGDAAAKNGPGSGSGSLFNWKYDKDVVLMLTEIDVGQHVSEQTGAGDFNPVDYKPQYWLINGLSFPNTIHANLTSGFNWDNWIAAHPGYDPLVVGRVNKKSFAGNTGEKVLLRMINLGFETQPMHMHGFHGKIIGSDQRAWIWAQPLQPILGAGKPGVGLEKNTLTIGSGETYEWLLDFGTWKNQPISTYAAGTQSRYNPGSNNLPVVNTDTSQPAIPGYTGGPEVSGVAGSDYLTNGQLFPFHNHDDYKATNNGVYPGGMFTMIQTVP